MIANPLPSHRTGLYVSLLAIACCGCATTLAQPPAVGVNAGAPISGDSILFTDALAADIASSGCRFVRINFIGSASGWDAARLAKYDTIIGNARNHNLEVLAVFSNETVWGWSQAQWNENYNTTGMNAYVTEYAETAWLLINHFKDDIKLYELWNEPSCWSVDPQSNPLNPGCSYIWPRIFANLMAETYKECIEQGGATFFANNEVSLVSGGLFAHDIGGTNPASATAYAHDTYTQTDIWDAFQTNPLNPSGRRYPWDYFGYHFYLNGGGAVSISELDIYFNRDTWGHVNDGIRVEQLNHGDTAPILVTEFGWTTQGVGEDGKAANLTATYNWLRTQPFIAAAMWYQYNCCDPNGNWGLTIGLGNYLAAWYAFSEQCGQVPAPTADFNAGPTNGPAPLEVQFNNTSIGSVDTYAWDFGDDTTSDQEDPLHTYAEPGTYTVSLNVTGPGGSDAITRIDYISVAPPLNVADLDNDGDADLHDLARFAPCFSGSGITTPPAGCGGAPQAGTPIADWSFASSLAALPYGIANDDLLDGLSGTLEAGGFHEATPGGTAGGLADLTDGVVGANVEAVLADYSRPSLQVRYDFATPQAISAIRVFADNSDGRVFQNYDVACSLVGSSSYQTLLAGITTGPFGQINDGSTPASVTTIATEQPGGAIAVDVDALRFTFYDVSSVEPAAVFWDPWDTDEAQDTDGNPRAYVGTVVKEIDVLGAGVQNASDLDGDLDADVDDLLVFEGFLTGP